MKKAVSILLIFTVCLLSAFQQTVSAQDTPNVKRAFKNTIHVNITNPIIFGIRSIVFGYERVLNKRRSFSVNAGLNSFPTTSIILSDSIKSNALIGQKGFNISADYRFYLTKENKYDIPRGVYLGPYLSYNNFQKDHRWHVISTAGGTVPIDSRTVLKVTTMGLEIGYQFVFWNRISVDMVLFGPGLAEYNLKAKLGTNLSDADRKKLFQKLNEALADRFPGYGVVIDEEEFERQGSSNTTALGYRYMVQLGFRF